MLPRRTMLAATLGLGAFPASAAPRFAAFTNLASVAASLERGAPGAWPVSRIRYVATGTAAAVRLVYANWYVTPGQEHPTGGTLRIRAAVELASGRIVPCRFAGAPEGLVGPGEDVTSDPIPLPIASGEPFRIRTAVSSADGSWPSDIGLTGGAVPDGFLPGLAPGAELGPVPDAGRTVPGYGPGAVLGAALGEGPGPPACAIVGDSGAAGAGDRTGDADKNRGFLARALARSAGTVNLACSSETASGFVPASARRLELLRSAGCDRAVVLYGSNDIAAGHGAAPVQASLQAVWRMLAAAGVRVIAQCTILPKTAGPGGGALPGFEARGSVRAEVNAWIRSRPAPLAAVIDAAAAAEQDGLWRTPAGRVLTDDGAHPNAEGAAFLAGSIGVPALLSR